MPKRALILAGVKWDTTIQRHHAIAYHLSAIGYEVHFVEGIASSSFTIAKLFSRLRNMLFISSLGSAKVPRNNIRVITSPLINPQGGIFALFNNLRLRKLLASTSDNYDIIVNYLPVRTTQSIINRVSYKQLIYDCVRDFSNWGGYPPETSEIERELIHKADAVLVDSYYLYDKISKKYPIKEVVQVLPMLKNGQESILSQGIAPKKIHRISYIGQIAEHIDIAIMQSLARNGYELHHFGNAMLGVDIDMVTHGFISDPSRLAKQIIKNSDAILIPYRGNMDGVLPAKLFECLATNLPVFISDFYDSRVLHSMLYVYSSQEDLMRQLANYTVRDYSGKNKLIKRYLHDHSTEKEIKLFEKVIQKELS